MAQRNLDGELVQVEDRPNMPALPGLGDGGTTNNQEGMQELVEGTSMANNEDSAQSGGSNVANRVDQIKNNSEQEVNTTLDVEGENEKESDLKGAAKGGVGNDVDGAQEVNETSDVEELRDRESDLEGAAKRGDKSAIVDSENDVSTDDNDNDFEGGDGGEDKNTDMGSSKDDLDEGEVVRTVGENADTEATKNTHENQSETYADSEYKSVSPL